MPLSAKKIQRPLKQNKIVFLDAGTLDYGDVSFSALEKLGRFKAFYASSPEQVIIRSRGARNIIANKCRFDRAVFKALPGLKAVHVAATGVNNIDLEAAHAAGVAVTNVRGYSTESVVQFTLGFILNLASGTLALQKAAQDGTWSRSPFFTLAPTRICEVSGKTLGILGYGTIGKRVAEAARALGMKILAAKIPGRRYPASEAVRRVGLAALLKRADFVTIHAPLSEATRGLINRARLATMKLGACLINMARGGIVDEAALAQALRSGKLRGAALDVLEKEPPQARHPLLKAPNLLLTPHAAWASVEARRCLVNEIAKNIRAFGQGKKRNRIV